MARVIETEPEIADLVRGWKRLAVLGIKPETRGGEAGFYVPEALIELGIEVVPVPVYYPEVSQILGRPVIRDLRRVPGPVDGVIVFRKSSDVAAHVDDLIALHPPLVWLQSGIRDDASAARLVQAGINVVQDRCSMVDARRYR